MKYRIKEGDTLSQIAKDYGVSVDDLMASNSQIKDRDKIRAGDTIEVPAFRLGVLKRWWNWLRSPKG